ncbi:juvenile hormone esterase-like [Phlebotomus argentipes]|uniref:juvenile hormone esterase-like n=1 Tax=Phlebotomus argentipes TaxID=94469 RepID=UPI002892B48C|nr:juvenile hormone esterase-like [Phlebotomus argentipes]
MRFPSGSLHIVVVLILITFCLESCESRISDSLKVTLPHGGGIIGRYLRSFRGRGIRAFMGIPYAEQPVGNLRFRNPVAKAPWNGYLETVSNEVMCPQFDQLRNNVYSGKEDCLYLSVYAPQFPSRNDSLPVMVYFHGGGFRHGASSHYSPDFLLDHDIVLVVGNYRLGALGFLTTNTSDSPGNFGLKDQVETLKWVQQNIRAFGGDKDQVTIFGESAGGASVTYLMSYPSARGLFHRAIAQSGTYDNPWAFWDTAQALQSTVKLAEELRCDRLRHQNFTKLAECLQQKSVENILEATSRLVKWMGKPITVFPPSLEKDREGAFLTEPPKTMHVNHSLKIPLLIGLTSDEGAYVTASILGKPRFVQDLHERWNEVLPLLLYYNNFNEAKRAEITSSISNFYFGGKSGRLAMEVTQNFTDMFTDFIMLKGMDEYLRRRFQEGTKSADTFVYLFSHRGEGSFSDILAGPNSMNYGVAHCDELLYLFPLLDKPIFRAAPSMQDIFIQERMVKLWVNFATTGRPTPVENVDVEWSSADKFPLDYLRIGNYKKPNQSLFAMERDLWRERSEFVRDIF